MAADRGSAKEIQTKSRVGKVKASSFIFGVTTASLLAGFGLALGRVKRKNPTEFNEVAANKLALKALGYGTVISFCGCGLLILAVKWALGVRSIDDFSSKMKKNLPQKDGDFVHMFNSLKLPRTSDENDEKEWEIALSK